MTSGQSIKSCADRTGYLTFVFCSLFSPFVGFVGLFELVSPESCGENAGNSISIEFWRRVSSMEARNCLALRVCLGSLLMERVNTGDWYLLLLVDCC